MGAATNKAGEVSCGTVSEEMWLLFVNKHGHARSDEAVDDDRVGLSKVEDEELRMSCTVGREDVRVEVRDQLFQGRVACLQVG